MMEQLYKDRTTWRRLQKDLVCRDLPTVYKLSFLVLYISIWLTHCYTPCLTFESLVLDRSAFFGVKTQLSTLLASCIHLLSSLTNPLVTTEKVSRPHAIYYSPCPALLAALQYPRIGAETLMVSH
jgi:hypothetical protein